MLTFLKQFPGTQWNGDKRCWLFPAELEEQVREKASKLALPIALEYRPGPFAANVPEIDSRLHEFQKHAVARALRQGVHLLCFETGLGKSPTSIATARAADASRVLVVTQKAVLGQWRGFIQQWWSEGANRFEVVNFESLPKVAEQDFDVVIVDEVQNVKNYRSDRSKILTEILKRNPDAIRLVLSATPVDKPEEIFAIWNLLIPGVFGWWGKFRDRYCDVEVRLINDKEVTRVTGLKESTAEELRARIAYYTTSATKHDHRHLLQPFHVLCRRVDRGTSAIDLGNGPESAAALGSEDSWLNVLESEREIKIRQTLAWAFEQHTLGFKKLLIVTYRVDLAEEIFARLQEMGTALTLITGNTKFREEAILVAAAAPEGDCVASMKSIGVGTDALTTFPKVLIVEAHWSLSVMKQLLGRFQRLGGKIPTAAEFLVVKDSMGERIADGVVRKLSAVGMIFSPDATDTQITGALEQSTDDEEFLAELRNAMRGSNMSESGDWGE